LCHFSISYFLQDEEANDCNKGDGDDVESDEEFVSVDYSCGSMVWVKFSGWSRFFEKYRLIDFKGFPWWPCMVDYCPEVEETFLIDVEVDPNEAAKYHVVYEIVHFLQIIYFLIL
jgi:hypothetical protein